MNKSILGQKSFASQAQIAARIGSKPLVRAITMALLAGSAAVPVWAAESATTDCVPATYSETTGALVIPYVDVAQPDGNFKVYTANLQKLADQNGFAVSENDLVLKGESKTHEPCHGTFSGGELYLPYVKLMSDTDAVFEAVLGFSSDNPEVLYPTQVIAHQIAFSEEASSRLERALITNGTSTNETGKYVCPYREGYLAIRVGGWCFYIKVSIKTGPATQTGLATQTGPVYLPSPCK